MSLTTNGCYFSSISKVAAEKTWKGTTSSKSGFQANRRNFKTNMTNV